MSGGNRKVKYTLTKLQLLAAGLFKYMWPFCYHQVLKRYAEPGKILTLCSRALQICCNLSGLILSGRSKGVPSASLLSFTKLASILCWGSSHDVSLEQIYKQYYSFLKILCNPLQNPLKNSSKFIKGINIVYQFCNEDSNELK